MGATITPVTCFNRAIANPIGKPFRLLPPQALNPTPRFNRAIANPIGKPRSLWACAFCTSLCVSIAPSRIRSVSRVSFLPAQSPGRLPSFNRAIANPIGKPGVVGSGVHRRARCFNRAIANPIGKPGPPPHAYRAPRSGFNRAIANPIGKPLGSGASHIRAGRGFNRAIANPIGKPDYGVGWTNCVMAVSIAPSRIRSVSQSGCW